jgi:hypothetical protein
MNKFCKLCLSQAELLVDSHIVPRAFYEDLRARKLKRLAGDGRHTIYRKGIYGKFLCLGCEQKFGKIDQLAIGIIKKQKSWKKLHSSNSQNGFVVEDALTNRNVLHKFGLSLLWRAAASECTEFKDLSLGKYTEQLRTLFDSGSDDPKLNAKTSLYFNDFRGGKTESNQSFIAYRHHQKSRLFKQSYGNFHCHVFGFPYGELFIRLGGDNPRQGYFDLSFDNYKGRAVPWTSNLSQEYPNWFFCQGPNRSVKPMVGLIAPAE